MVLSALGGAAIDAGSSLLSNVVGAFSNHSNNKTQERIARDNRNWQTSERVSQNKWNLDQWNRQNEYNSTKSQVQRLKEGGINPYMALSGSAGGSATGNTTPLTSASPGSAPSMPQTHAFQPDFQTRFQESALQQSQIDSYNQGISESLKRIADLEETINTKKIFNKQYPEILNIQKWLAKNELDFAESTFMARKNAIDLQNRNMEAQHCLMYLGAQSQTTLNRYLDESERNRVALQAVTHAQILENIDLTVAQRKEAYSRISLNLANEIETYARTKGLEISNKVARQTADDMVMQIKADTLLKRYTWKSNAQSTNAENVSNYYKNRNETSYQRYYNKSLHLPDNGWINNSIRYYGHYFDYLVPLLGLK